MCTDGIVLNHVQGHFLSFGSMACPASKNWLHSMVSFFPPFAAAIKVEHENPATCEMWLVTWFLLVNAKNVFLAEIHGNIVKMCSEGAVNEGIVRKWCWLFREGRTNVRDLEWNGCLSLVTDDLKENVNAEVQEKRWFKISELHIFFLAGYSLRSDQETTGIVQDWLSLHNGLLWWRHTKARPTIWQVPSYTWGLQEK